MKLPAVFGKYHLLEKIAVGGMAEVFLAKSFGVAGFERLLVIKKILPHMAENEEFITMFVDEARIAASLTHSNIAQITDLGREEGDFFIAMEFIHGKDLSRVMEQVVRRGRKLPVHLAVLIASRICEGLDYAHRKKDSDGVSLNIVHRDVSPSNVLISYEGEVKLIDFGIARAQNRLGQTQAGVLKGKFGYMSPEQARGQQVDRRSDIFATGILLYEMLCGEKLFGSEGGISTLEKVCSAEIEPPSLRNREVPAELESVVMKALARDPQVRFQWASDLQDALAPFLLQKGALVTSKHLAIFMREYFSEQMREEAERLALYRRRGYPWLDEAVKERPGESEKEPPPAVENKNESFLPAAEAGAETPWPRPVMRPALRVTAGARSGSRPRMQPLGGLAPEREGAFSRPAPARRSTGTEPKRKIIPPPQPLSAWRRATGILAPFFAGLAVAVVAALAALWLFSPGEDADSAPPMPKVHKKETEPATSPLVPPEEEAEPAASFSKIENRPEQTSVPPKDDFSGLALDLSASAEKEKQPQQPEKPAPPPAPQEKATAPPPAQEKTAGPPATAKNPAESQAAAKEAEKRPDLHLAGRDNYGQLSVASRPSGAEVLLNGKPSGRTPLVLNQLDVQANYFVVLKLEGYKTFMKGVKFGAQKQLALEAELMPLETAEKPGNGFLVANTKPWARLMVDGKDTGLWTPIPPTKKLELPAGKHKLLFRTQDGRELVKEVEIVPGETTKVIEEIP